MSARWLVVVLLVATLVSVSSVGCTRPAGTKKGLSTTTGR